MDSLEFCLNPLPKMFILPRQSADLPRQTTSETSNFRESIAKLLKNVLAFCFLDMALKKNPDLAEKDASSFFGQKKNAKTKSSQVFKLGLEFKIL